MTGFGSAEDRVLRGRLRIDIRTVNHRYFNPQLKLPADLAGVESEMRERLRQLLERGHVAVTARWVEGPGPEREITIDLSRARQVVAAAQQLKKKLKLKGTVDLAVVARQPDVMTATNGGTEQPVQWSDVQPIVERAARDVVAMREREGQALATELNSRLDALEAAAQTIEEQAPARLKAEHERLKQAVAELTAQAAVDEQRLALEIALLADRVDITEELVRFRSHVAAARAALRADQAAGKQLGFLSQELLREVNTMGSKANDARITQTVIAMKGTSKSFGSSWRTWSDAANSRPVRAIGGRQDDDRQSSAGAVSGSVRVLGLRDDQETTSGRTRRRRLLLSNTLAVSGGRRRGPVSRVCRVRWRALRHAEGGSGEGAAVR